MFEHLTSARRALRRFSDEVDVDGLSPLEAEVAIEQLALIEKRAAGGRLRLLRALESDQATVDWVSQRTGQTKREAQRDVDAAGSVSPGSATDSALRDGDLSADQAREVASAAAADPSAEKDLLDSAHNESMAELKRKAKKTRAAATDGPEKDERARKERTLAFGTDEETGRAWGHFSGPAADVARIQSYLEPFIQARFERARREGGRESRGAYAFDALLDALAAGSGAGSGTVKPATNRARILIRVDAPAAKRGHTEPGETCEIDGLGPVPVSALRDLLPDAAIEVIITNGTNVWNVTNLARKPSANQQVILDWIGEQCARQGCGATRNLQIDHRIDWAHTHVTELRALDPLCPHDHDLKTHQGWSLVDGTGRRRMVPPDHPDHPANAPPANAPPAAAADANASPGHADAA